MANINNIEYIVNNFNYIIKNLNPNINGFNEIQFLNYAVTLYNNTKNTLLPLLNELKQNKYGEIRNVYGFTYKLFVYHTGANQLEYGFVQVEEDEPQNIVNVFTSVQHIIDMLMDIGLNDIVFFNDPNCNHNKPWETIENTVLTQIEDARYIADRTIEPLILA